MLKNTIQKNVKTKLVILTGPTASGKTALSIELAKRCGGEIISADSMQVYKGMDIGTAKITAEEMDGIAHYLIDVLEPTEELNVFSWVEMAKRSIADISARGKLPIVVGGTGFYIRALLYDCDFSEEGSEEQAHVRAKYENLAEEKGKQYLHDMLRKIDPVSAEKIHANNVKRVIRALEYHELTGRLVSEDNEKNRMKSSPYDFAYFVIDVPREELYKRIDARVDRMIEDGLVDEVRRLREQGLKKDDNSMLAIGYRQLFSYLDGELSLAEAAEDIKKDTRHFAKRQLTWFRKEREVCFIKQGDIEAVMDVLLEKGMIGEKE